MNTRPIYSIRFPLVKEKTGYRKGPRYRLMADKSGLWGARACAAGMVSSAILYRDSHISKSPLGLKLDRLQMRTSALWARVFAGHIEDTDARLLALEAECRALMTQFMASSWAA